MRNVKCSFFWSLSLQNRWHLLSLCSCKYSAVDIMTTYRLNDQGIAVVKEVLLFSRNAQTNSGVHPPSCLMNTRGLSPWGKWPFVKLTAHSIQCPGYKCVGLYHCHPQTFTTRTGTLTLPSFTKKHIYDQQQHKSGTYIHTYTTNYWNCNWQNSE
jgi:hypothetical protein